MAKRKTPLNAWETVNPSEEVHYVRISKSLLQHKAFTELSFSARHLYLCMCEGCANKLSFKFAHGHYTAYGFTKPTFTRARNELIRAGFLSLEKCGKTNRTPNVYRWCFDWKKE